MIVLPPHSPTHRPARAKEPEKKCVAVQSTYDLPADINGRLLLKSKLRVLPPPACESKLKVVK